MIGQMLAQYQILEKIGEGGMGIVYKAQDTKLQRIVALKFLPQHLTANQAEKDRLFQEARSAATLNHPNICTIHDIRDEDNRPYIVMEYIDGTTLAEKIRGPLTIRDAVEYAIQIGEALEEAHGHGVIHRDIKAENIMVTARNRIKVMDFGLAKLKGSVKLTRTSSTVGTLAYMAPEQVQGGQADARADIFSFGVVLYEMLTGKTPFRGDHEAALLYSIVNEQPEPIQNFRSDVPSEIVHLLNRALEKDPADRYQSVSEMVIDLRRTRKESSRVSVGQVPRQDSRTPEKKVRTPMVLTSVVVAIVAIVALSYILFWKTDKPIDSIAVLPLVNESGDQSMEYLSDGISETIINSLSHLPQIRVVSRSSSFRYKGKDVSPQAVGRDLNVRAILTGRMMQRGNDLSVSIELVDTKDDRQIWGQKYVRQSADIFALQAMLAKEVSEQLRPRLSGEEQKRITKHYTDNTEAYELYLKGRYLWNRRDEQDLKKAVEYFNQAIEKDPNFALAYAGLASSYVVLPEYAGLPVREMYSKAQAAAHRALQLDDGLAEGRAVMGLVNQNLELDAQGAELEYKKAIEIDPNFATAHHWYSILLRRFLGRMDQALSEIQKAQELDPLSPVITVNVGETYFFKKDYPRATGEMRKLIELDPTFALSHYQLGFMYLLTGELQSAVEEFETVRTIVGKGPYGLGGLGCAYARAGRTADAQKVIAQLSTFLKQGYAMEFSLALTYFGLDDRVSMFLWLERACDTRAIGIERLKYDPLFDPLRSDSRFAALLKKYGLDRWGP
jgi:serine/threonine-protein kinase